jgi:hypothetical protein
MNREEETVTAFGGWGEGKGVRMEGLGEEEDDGG